MWSPLRINFHRKDTQMETTKCFYKNLNNNTDGAMSIYMNKALEFDEVDLKTKFEDLISV